MDTTGISFKRWDKPIRLNHRGTTIMKIFGFDTETCKGRPMSFQIFGENFSVIEFEKDPGKFFESFVEYIDSLSSGKNKIPTVFFAHNLEFDLCIVLYAYLEKLLGDEFDFTVKKGKEEIRIQGFFGTPSPNYARFTFCRSGKVVEFIDTAAFFMMKLEKLAEEFKIEEGKHSIPKGLGEKRFSLKDKVFCAYALNDAKLTYLIGCKIYEFHERFNVKLSISLPQLAERIFRHDFLKEEIPPVPFEMLYPSLKSYHGGKNGIYMKKGIYKNIYLYDLVSAYAYAMTALPQFVKGNYFKTDTFKAGYCGIYQVSGEAGKCPYPIFYSDGFKPVFGKFEKLWVTGFELSEAMNNSAAMKSLKVLKGYIWAPNKSYAYSPLKAYVMEFWRLKNEAAKDTADYLFYKKLVNSLYGKFIQRRLEKKNDDDLKPSFICGQMFQPFIASMITGMVRALIYRWEINFNSLHTATDSIMTKKKIPEKFLGSSLGDLKFELKGDLTLFRNKLYIFKNEKGKIAKYALHGFRGKVDDLDAMSKHLDKDEISYEYTKMNKLKESKIQGITPFIMERKKAVLNIKNT